MEILKPKQYYHALLAQKLITECCVLNRIMLLLMNSSAPLRMAAVIW